MGPRAPGPGPPGLELIRGCSGKVGDCRLPQWGRSLSSDRAWEEKRKYPQYRYPSS